MENKNISLKFILQAQTKYKTFTMRYVFSVTNQKIYSAKCLTPKIQTSEK